MMRLVWKRETIRQGTELWCHRWSLLVEAGALIGGRRQLARAGALRPLQKCPVPL